MRLYFEMRRIDCVVTPFDTCSCTCNCAEPTNKRGDLGKNGIIQGNQGKGVANSGDVCKMRSGDNKPGSVRNPCSRSRRCLSAEHAEECLLVLLLLLPRSAAAAAAVHSIFFQIFRLPQGRQDAHRPSITSTPRRRGCLKLHCWQCSGMKLCCGFRSRILRL